MIKSLSSLDVLFAAGQCRGLRHDNFVLINRTPIQPHGGRCGANVGAARRHYTGAGYRSCVVFFRQGRHDNESSFRVVERTCTLISSVHAALVINSDEIIVLDTVGLILLADLYISLPKPAVANGLPNI